MVSPEGRTLRQPRPYPPLEALAANGRVGAEKRPTGWSIGETSDVSSDRPASQNDCEKRISRNSPKVAVALNCGMAPSSLNADVNAFERLQIVRGRNSSHFGSK